MDIPLAQLESQRVLDRPDPELRGAVRAVEREDDEPADRPDVHDSPLAASDEWQERLDHGNGAEEVDLELHPEVSHGLELDGRRFGDARVVHESGETALADGALDLRRRRGDCRLVRDVD